MLVAVRSPLLWYRMLYVFIFSFRLRDHPFDAPTFASSLRYVNQFRYAFFAYLFRTCWHGIRSCMQRAKRQKPRAILSEESC